MEIVTLDEFVIGATCPIDKFSLDILRRSIQSKIDELNNIYHSDPGEATKIERELHGMKVASFCLGIGVSYSYENPIVEGK